MEINLSTFLSKLRNYNPELHISPNYNTSIKSIKLLQKNQCSFHNNCLYVGTVSNLPKVFPQNTVINLVCILNKTLPNKHIKNPMLNLILLNNDIDLATVFNDLQSVVESEQTLALNSATLLDSLTSGKGIKHIINVASELLGNPICVIDLSFKIIAHSKDINPSDPIWVELFTKGYCSYNFVSVSNVKKFIEVVHKSTSPVFMSEDKFRIPRIISNIKIDNKVVGYLAALECNKPFSENDMELVFTLCKVISSEMQKSRFIENTKGSRYEHFIIHLLSGEKIDKITIDERLEFLDLHFKHNLYVMVLNVPQNNFVNIPLNQIRDRIDYMIVDSKSIIYNDAIVVIINCNNKISPIDKTFSKLLEFMQKNKIFAGLSRCFHNLTDMKSYYEQALKAIELGISLKTNEFFFSYEDFTIYHLLQLCSSQSNLKNFCLSSIFSLIKYDHTNNTDYMKSLYTYLLNGKNQLETADKLKVCRSTLAHRIEKIQQIMDINLNDSITSFKLILTFIILDYIDKTKSYNELNIDDKSSQNNCIL
ncbi:PucR family transcriptional regulator [Clostridium sp. JS66]|uniref:PucR family transcriptional regulator n=1 Tax=Clostridium sp. JS66 TaxID=3064705 RepID=UPI00298EA2E5|nr:helix-turn-helix domain-containing protein [Clostridium sp. JS66]WPC43599.1 helix-turn-helix domain-containing protein [Clostridium sp. JS66]